ncbi:MAG TPA: hypothetical protein VMJ10_12525 [Kofleriaceae bacterium]|nr:hypothetical protein [Kofleriaceae bacterium]
MTDRNDDDYLAGPVPEPDAEPSAAERAHAKTFAELVDKTLAGRMPAAMSADDRALVEVATVIRAASGEVELPVARRRAVVEDALRQAVGGAGAATTAGAIVTLPRRRWAPWAVAGASSLVAAAALAVLWLRAPRVAEEVAPPPPEVRATPASWRSRPADPLVGRIQRDHAGDAATRIDTIFADRLDGYRERRLVGGKP